MSDFSIPDIQEDDTRARMQALGYIDSSPDNAARAMELEKATGTPAAVIDGDLEGFEKQHKAQLAGGIVNGNPHIADYVNSHPMASRISNDDYGNLDQASVSLDGLKPRSVLGAAAEGFREGSGYGEEGVPFIGSWLIRDEQSMREALDHPLLYSIASAIGAIPETLMRGLGGAVQAVTSAGGEVAAEVLNDPRARQWGKEFGQFLLDPAVAGMIPHSPKAAEFNQQLREAAISIKPYIEAGVEPPVGTHPVLDAIKGAQNEIDLDHLNDALKASQASLTRERNPDLYANFIRLKTGDQSIGVSADAVRKLYGDKVPHPEDGLLGFVPDLEAKLQAAEAVGGHVEVPLADYLAKVEPEVAKGLEEDIRVRPEGVTKNEAVQAKAMVEAYHGSPHEFDAFSMEKIGTGEGAQSYGHGLYFAENPEVAGQYQKNLSGIDAYHVFDKEGKKVDEFLDVGHAKRAAEFIGGTYKKLEGSSGNQYRVRIHADKEQFLDWDKPFAEQHPNVQAALEKLGLPKDKLGKISGAGIHELLMNDAGAEIGKLNKAPVVSKLLHEAGIPGIKYLDQGSRARDTDPARLKQNVQNWTEIVAKREERMAARGNETDAQDLAEAKRLLAEAIEFEKTGGGQTHNLVLFDDSLIEIIDRNGQAVSAIRKAAMLDKKLPTADQIEQAASTRTTVITTPDGSEVSFVKSSKMTKIEKQLATDAKEIIDRILGKGDVKVLPADEINFAGTGKEVVGLNVSQEGMVPVIAYALSSGRVERTVRHEAIHQLMNWGLITKEEWTAVKEAAEAKNAQGKDWLDKHNIRERYKDQNLDRDALVEEAFAEEFGEWGTITDKADKQVKEYSKLVDQAFGKIQAFFKELYDKIAAYFDHPPDVKDLFESIESGEVGKRSSPEAREGSKAAEKIPFGPGVIGHQKRYLELIQKQLKEDFDATAKRAMEDQKRKLTTEWKKNSAEMRNEVADELLQRPDIAADRYFLDGLYAGEKVEPEKIATDSVPTEVREGLSKNYFRKDGASPDDLASMLGFPSGKAMIESLVRFNEAKKSSGMRPFEYVRRLIDAETERRMEAKHGKLGDKILEEAKEQVLSETQVDLLHEETLKLATDAGLEFTLTKEQIKAGVKDLFAKEKASDVSSDKFIADAGRAGRAMEEAFLKDNKAEAFRQKQRQYLATVFSREALELEKAKKEFEKLSSRLTRKDIKNIDKDFVNWAQDILVRSGVNIKRSFPELQDSLERSGFKTLDDFVSSKKGDGWELTIAPEVLDPRFGEKYRDQGQDYLSGATVEEFQNVKDAVDQLDYVGKAAQKIEVAGAKMDFADFKSEVIRNIEELPPRDKAKMKRLIYRMDAELVRMEEVFKDLDLRKEAGPLFSAMIRPMIDAKHTEYTMLEALSKKLTEIKGANKDWQKTLKDTIPQDFFFDPYDNTPFDMTREHMIQVMLNFGNKSNIEKFTKGYAGDRASWLEQKLRQMFDTHATKEDWEYAQNIWDVWAGWKKESAELYYKLSGRQPQWIESQPIQTPHGEFKGGYFPIIYDRLRSNINSIEEKQSPNALFGPNYFRASPANHYTQSRTGYSAPIQFQASIEQVASRMQQMIHDISYREAVMNTSKVIYDKDIRAAIRKHYGPEYEAQLSPWLKDIANHFNLDEAKVGFVNAILRRARMNLVAHALGFNLRVIGSPAIAKGNPADMMRVYNDYSNASKLAYEKSREIPHTFRNIDRDFRERLEQTITQGGLSKLQADAMRWSFLPTVKIEQQFRIITFVNEYKQALARGLSDGDAAAHADSLVRERHGASGLPDMPAIMRGSESMKMATMFYGYFSAMYNWQRQMPQQARAGDFKKLTATMWGSVLIPSAFGALMFNNSREGDSWWKHIGKALVLQPLSTVVLLRDFANFFLEGNPARSPLSTLASALSSAKTDLGNYMSHKPVKKPIQHAGNVIGLATGLPLAQISRTAQFAVDVKTGQQRPRNIIEWARGLVGGEARLKK